MPARRITLVGSTGVVAVVLCLLTLLVPANTAHACSCASAGSPAEALADADAVFAGEVTSVKFSGTSPYRLSSAALVTVEFGVSRIWKGPRLATLTVETERREVSCGFEFKKGQHYIVYTSRRHANRACAPAPRRPGGRLCDVVAHWGRDGRRNRWPSPETAGRKRYACSASSPRSGEQSRGCRHALALLAGIAGLGIRRRPRL